MTTLAANSSPAIACAQGMPAMEAVTARVASTGGDDIIGHAYAADASCRNSSDAISALDHQVRAVRVKRIFTDKW